MNIEEEGGRGVFTCSFSLTAVLPRIYALKDMKKSRSSDQLI